MQDATATPTPAPAQDAQGRIVVGELTDRQIAEETLVYLRAFADAFSAATKNPMMRAMLPNIPGI